MDETVAKELQDLYQQLDADISLERPRCDASGRCCRFREYGHTLFLSEVEADFLLEGAGTGGVVDEGGCPFQVDGLCAAREKRPLGCRVYFCDAGYADRMVELAEEHTRRLKDLHVRHGLSWRYAPLHSWLRERGAPAIDRSRPMERSPVQLVTLKLP